MLLLLIFEHVLEVGEAFFRPNLTMGKGPAFPILEVAFPEVRLAEGEACVGIGNRQTH